MYLTRRLLRHKLASGEELWLNALSGAADRLSAGESSLVADCLAGGDALGGELLAKLISRGYLFADRDEETAAFDRLVDRFLRISAGTGSVRHLIVCPTYSCNLRCVYCFESRSHAGMSREVMGLDAAAAVLTAFGQLRAAEPDHRYTLGLFGGEPLMRGNRRVISFLLDGARRLELPVTIVTNGVNIPSYMKLLDEHAANIHIIQITLDGPGEIHDLRRPTAGGKGSFGAIATAMDMLLERGIKVIMRVNIDRGNVRDLPRLAAIATERGWAARENFKASIAPVRDHVGTGGIPDITPDAELLSLLLDVYDEEPELEEMFGLDGFQVLSPLAGLRGAGKPGDPRVHYCEANHGGFCVAGPDGLLYPCPEAIGQPRLAIGRYLPGLELWHEEVNKWKGRSIKGLAGCRDCSIGPLCGGGCTYASMARDNESAEPVCDQDLAGAIEVFLRRRVL